MIKSVLWRKYGHVIDYVNFQFYAYNLIKSVDWFLELFGEQQAIYNVGQLLANFSTDHEAAGGLTPVTGFLLHVRS